MNDKIMYNGEEFADHFVATTKFTPSLKMRLEFLFCSSTNVIHESYTKEVMPLERSLCTVQIIGI